MMIVERAMVSIFFMTVYSNVCREDYASYVFYYCVLCLLLGSFYMMIVERAMVSTLFITVYSNVCREDYASYVFIIVFCVCC